jgi:hypothetical protein
MPIYQNAHIRRFSPDHAREVGITVSLEGEGTARVAMTILGASEARSVVRLHAEDVALLADALMAAAKAMTVPDRLEYKASSR